MSKAHRVQTLKVNLLDTGENLLGELPGVEGGGFEYNTNAIVKTSGSLDVVGVTSRDWTNLRVQPVISVDGEDHPLGCFFPPPPKPRGMTTSQPKLWTCSTSLRSLTRQ